MSLAKFKEPAAVAGAHVVAATRRGLRPVSVRLSRDVPHPANAHPAKAETTGQRRPALPGTAEFAENQGTTFAVLALDPGAEQGLTFAWQRPDGTAYGSIGNLRRDWAAAGWTLLFAMNGGIYGADRRPLGLLVSDGTELAPLNLDSGRGNFFLKPNGALLITGAGPVVAAASAELRPACSPAAGVRQALQSGPMLVIDGAIHPGFLPDSRSRHIRAGAGVSEDGRLKFAFSDHPTNLHGFATFFRDYLGCPNALVLDGQISRMYLPELGFHALWPWKPLVGIIALGAPG